MDYTKLPVICKRYSFTSKMQILNYYSSKIYNINGMTYELNNPLPWELENLLMFFIKAQEYSSKDLFLKNRKKFIEMVNCVKKYTHPKVDEYAGNMKYAELVMPLIGMLEFNTQEMPIYKLYRYTFFFNYVDNDINMPLEFNKKFGEEYFNFRDLGFQLLALSSVAIDLEIPIDIINFLITKYSNAYMKLTISRGNFSKLIDQYSMNNIDNYLYCVRPSYTYPFIEYNNNIYLPLPHVLIRSVTDSMLFRLTAEDKTIRDKFGFIFEAYIYEIMADTEIYDEVLREKTFDKKRNLKTPDIMCKNNNNFLFIECKSIVPSIAMRCADENAFNEQIERYAKAIHQLFKQIYVYFGNKYNYFQEKSKIIKNNCYGLVVILEENHTMREPIFKKAKELYKYSDNEYDWLISHISICSTIDIEKFCFTKSNILDSLIKQMKEKNYFYYSFQNCINNKVVYDKLLDFESKQEQKLKITITEFLNKERK